MTNRPPDALAPAPDLLPCPWCGKVPEMKSESVGPLGSMDCFFYVECSDRSRNHGYVNGDTAEEVTSLWNARPTPSPVSQAPAPLGSPLDVLGAAIERDVGMQLNGDSITERYVALKAAAHEILGRPSPVEGKGPGGVAPEYVFRDGFYAGAESQGWSDADQAGCDMQIGRALEEAWKKYQIRTAPEAVADGKPVTEGGYECSR